MQDNKEWQIDMQPVIRNLIAGKNIYIIIMLSLFGFIAGTIAYPFVLKNIDYEVKIEILPVTDLQNPIMKKYITSDDMLREFGMIIRSIKNDYVSGIEDYGLESKYSQLIISSTITNYQKKIYFEAQSNDKEDLEVYTELILKKGESILTNKIAENINKEYELAKNIAAANLNNINSFVLSYEDLVGMTKSFVDMGGDNLSTDMGMEYLEVMTEIYIDSFETTPQLTELDTLVNNYDYSYMPVYYDKTTIIGKRPFLNGQVFSLLFLFIGFTISLVLIGIRNTLNSENN